MGIEPPSPQEAGAASENVAQRERAWAGLRAAADFARRASREAGGNGEHGAVIDARGRLVEARGLRPGGAPVLEWRTGAGWAVAPAAPAAQRALLELYLPVCNASPERPFTVGHLGQSLDGYIATVSGESHYVTGPENLLHLHRMRALCDVVVVGAETVAKDDPRLTTRLAPGPNPVRAVIDPQRRLSGPYGVFEDGAAPTLVFCDAARVQDEGEAGGSEGGSASRGNRPGGSEGGGCERDGRVETIGVPSYGGLLRLDVVLAALHERGYPTVFVEGGGATVSAFLQAGLLDRLQVAIAPLVIGHGRPGISLPAFGPLGECLRPVHRGFAMGRDVLFDCDLRASPDAGGPGEGGELRRIF